MEMDIYQIHLIPIDAPFSFLLNAPSSASEITLHAELFSEAPSPCRGQRCRVGFLPPWFIILNPIHIRFWPRRDSTVWGGGAWAVLFHGSFLKAEESRREEELEEVGGSGHVGAARPLAHLTVQRGATAAEGRFLPRRRRGCTREKNLGRAHSE
jgi:hypothetical protein